MKKKIYVCPFCGRALNFSIDENYTFFCVECGSHFHEYEATTEEQKRMEGIVDYTELTEAAMKVKEITDKAIQESHKQIEIKGKDIVGQVVEYVYETIKPVLVADMHKISRFRDSTAIYSSHFQLSFGNYGVNGKAYQAQLYGHNGTLRVYFNHDGYIIEEAGSETMLRWLVEEWAKLKDSMKRMIPYAINRCNEENEKALEKQKEMSNIINSFRL